MPHPCLDARFLTPRLISTFELLAADEESGGTELAPEACTIAVDAVEAELRDGGVEVSCEQR